MNGNYNTHEYTPSILLNDEIEYFNSLLNIKKNQYLIGGFIMEVADDTLVPIRGNSNSYNYAELSHAVYLTKKHFDRVK